MKRIYVICSLAFLAAICATLAMNSVALAAVGSTEAELERIAKQAEETKKAIDKHYTDEGLQKPSSDGMEDGRDVAAAAKKGKQATVSKPRAGQNPSKRTFLGENSKSGSKATGGGITPNVDKQCAPLTSAQQSLCIDGRGVLTDQNGNVRTWNSLDEAAVGVKKEFLGACGIDREMSISIYEKDGRYYVSGIKGGKEDSVVPELSAIDDCFGGKLAGAVHNHPWPEDWTSDNLGDNRLSELLDVTNPGSIRERYREVTSSDYYPLRNAWPSVSDARVARMQNIDCFVVECKSNFDDLLNNDVMLVVEKNGKIKRMIERNGRNTRVPQERSKLYEKCDVNDGKTRWDSSKIQELDDWLARNESNVDGKKAPKKSQVCEVEKDYSVDASKLEELLKKRIAYMQNLLSRGGRATQGEVAALNAMSEEYLKELIALNNKIEAFDIPQAEKERIANEAIKPLIPYLEQLQWLGGEMERQKIMEISPNPLLKQLQQQDEMSPKE